MLIKIILLYLMCFLYAGLSAIVYTKGHNRNLSNGFVLFSFSLMIWSFGLAQYFITQELSKCVFWANFLYVAGSFVAATFLLFSFVYPNPRFKYISTISILVIGPPILLGVMALSSYGLVRNVIEIDGMKTFIYGPLRILWEIQFNASLALAFFRFFRLYTKSTGLQKSQYLYITIANLTINMFSGFTNVFLLWFGIQDYIWLGPPLTLIWFALIFYAIFKYRLMDIEVAITRVGIFVCVYTLVLGIPFYCAYSLGLWKHSLWLMMVLATTGPFIYLFIQKQAEKKLLEEQHQYQQTLQQASLGMGQIKGLGRLLKLIVHIVTRAVAIEHCEIYLYHEESKQFTLKSSRGWLERKDDQASVIAFDSSLVSYLKETKESVVYDEIEKYAEDHGDKKLEDVINVIKQLDGALIVPSFMDQKLIAILILGQKKSGKLYTQDDMAVFTILANQAGLAIENAQFYEKMSETHQQLLKAEKMATVGTMADGLSHQINNRLHAMGFIAGDAIDTIKLKKKGKLSADMKKLLNEIEHSLERIEDNVKRGGEIVEGLLKYTRKGSEGFEAIDLNALLDASLEMVQFKININEMAIVRNFNSDVPMIKGNFTQLQEVFFNLIDNAYDAMMQRKVELKEPGFKAQLEISANQVDHKLEILIQDNGMGVKPENMEKLFTPFFTTKLSSKKGTGLGLYVIRQVIEENHGGKVRFNSQYQKGSETKILLPIAIGDTDKQNKDKKE